MDANSGVSTSFPWKTIAKVNSSTFQPGDSILFKKGEMWREQLTVPSSGVSGNVITFGAFGTGNNPLITGLDDITGTASDWTNQGSNVWSHSLPNQTMLGIFNTSALGILETGISTINANYEFFWDNNFKVWGGPILTNPVMQPMDIAAQASASAAMMVYHKGTDTTPRYRLWNGSGWGAETSATAVSGTIQYQVLKFSRTRNEAILGTLDSTGDIRTQIWNGSAWSATTLHANVGATNDDQRGFDIAYETNGDRAIIVFNNANAANPAYQIWNSSSWSSASSITVPTLGAPLWIELAPNPLSASNEIAMMLIDTNIDIYGMAWSGTTWSDMGDTAVWDATGSIATKESIDVAYEQLSGRAMFIWGDSIATDQYYRLWNGASLTAATLLDIAASGGLCEWMRLVSRPSSNELMYGCQDAGADLNTRLWSGSAWDTATEHPEHDAATENILSRNFDIAWETHSANLGKAWLVWGNDATVSRKQWSGTTWGTAVTAGDDTALVILYAHPNTGAVFSLMYEDSTSVTQDILESHLTGGETTWSSGVLYVYAASNPTSYYTKIEATQRAGVINTPDKDYLLIEKLTVSGGQRLGTGAFGCIDILANSNNITIQNMTINKCHGYGVQVTKGTVITITNNVISDIKSHATGTSGDGIAIRPAAGTPSDQVTISNNTINAFIDRQAIAIISATNITIDSNTTTDKQIDLEPSSVGDVISNAVVSNNTITVSGKGIGLDTGSGITSNITFENNTINSNGTNVCMSMNPTSGSNYIRQNTINNCTTGIHVDTTTGTYLVSNNTVTAVNTYGIRAEDGATATIENNTINCSGIGLGVSMSLTDGSNYIRQNTINNCNTGINIAGGTGTHFVRNNTVTLANTSGIQINGGAAAIIEKNAFFGTQGGTGDNLGGLFAFDNLTSVTVTNNIFSKFRIGIKVKDNTATATIYNNIIHNWILRGLEVALSSTATLKNNIFYNTGTFTNHIIKATGTIYTGNYNLFYPSGIYYSWDGSLGTFSNWRSSSGQDANSFEADPLFVNASGTFSQANDFKLQANSPAIDRGEDVNLSTDYAGKQRYDHPNIANTGSTGAFSYNYWDLGAYEYNTPPNPVLQSSSHPQEGTQYCNKFSVNASLSSNHSSTTHYHYLTTQNSSSSLSEVSGGTQDDDGTITPTLSDFGIWYLRLIAHNLDHDNSANFAAYTLNVPQCLSGGFLPPEAYNTPIAPEGGFKVLINNGAEKTNSPKITLTLRGNPDIKTIWLSENTNFPEKQQVSYDPSQPQTSFSLSSGQGTKTVYAKFCNQWNRCSDIVSDTIIFSEEKPAPVLFVKYLSFGQFNTDIKRLQIFLNQDPETALADSGPGSIGQETNFFGPLTKAAVIKFQEKYVQDVLAPWNLTRGTGFVGKTTLAKINEIINK